MEEVSINDLEMSSSTTLPVVPFLEEPETVVQTSHDTNDTTRSDMTNGVEKGQRSSSFGGWSSSISISRSRHASLKVMEKHCISMTVAPKLVMLAYLVWYILVVALIDHSESSIKPFVDAIVIMILIGLVLNANAYLSFMASSSPDENNDDNTNKSGGSNKLWMYLRTNFWSVLRLFLIPYAVSSYAGVASSAVEGTFVSVFPTDPAVWGPALGGALGVPICLLAIRSFLAFYIPKHPPPQ
eukprot:scaffold29330_cov56-Attheya_sp.AAC.2